MSGSLWETETETQTERDVKRNRERLNVCMREKGAGIPPEPQLNQAQKNIAARQTCGAWLQLWHNSSGFSTSILPKYRPLARCQKGSCNSIISAQKNTSKIYLSVLCAADQFTMQSVSQLDSFLFEDDWKMISHPINHQFKNTCLLSFLFIRTEGMKSSAHANTRPPNPHSKHYFICVSL